MRTMMLLCLLMSAQAFAVDYTKPLPSDPEARAVAALESFHQTLNADKWSHWIGVDSPKEEWWFNRGAYPAFDVNQPTLHKRYVELKIFVKDESRVIDGALLISCETNMFVTSGSQPPEFTRTPRLIKDGGPISYIRQIVCKQN